MNYIISRNITMLGIGNYEDEFSINYDEPYNTEVSNIEEISELERIKTKLKGSYDKSCYSDKYKIKPDYHKLYKDNIVDEKNMILLNASNKLPKKSSKNKPTEGFHLMKTCPINDKIEQIEKKNNMMMMIIFFLIIVVIIQNFKSVTRPIYIIDDSNNRKIIE